MNIQQRNSAYHFRMQSEREQTLGPQVWGQMGPQVLYTFPAGHVGEVGVMATEVVVLPMYVVCRRIGGGKK